MSPMDEQKLVHNVSIGTHSCTVGNRIVTVKRLGDRGRDVVVVMVDPRKGLGGRLALTTGDHAFGGVRGVEDRHGDSFVVEADRFVHVKQIYRHRLN
jgi:hypothetical protein